MRARKTWAALGWVGLTSLACSMGWTDELPDIAPSQAAPVEARAEKEEGKCATWNEPGNRKIEVSVDGKSYPVTIRIPRDRTSDTLVMLLHGGNGNVQKVLKQTGYPEFSEKHGVALAIPEGDVQVDLDGKKKWNSGKRPFPNGRNDTKFLDAIASKARENGCMKKVAAIGFSNGAQMVNRWACEGQELDAAVGVAGGLLVPPNTCTGRAVPVLLYVGSNDDAYDGSPSSHAELPSILDSVAAWRKNNQCQEESVAALDVRSTSCRTWEGKAPVRFCLTKGMGHGYPINKNGRTINATEDSWEWIQAL